MTGKSSQSREQEYLQVYQQVTRMISMVLDHQEVMDTVVRALPGLLDVDACSIRLLDNGTNTFVLGAAHGLSIEYLSRATIDSEETMAMIKAGRPVARTGLDCDRNYRDRQAAAQEGIRSVLNLPILFQDSIIGVMRLLTRDHREFTEEEIAFAMSLAEQVGIAISNGRTYQKINLLFHQIEENERFVTNILDCIRPELLVVDRNRCIVLANRVFQQRVGMEESTILGMKYTELCPMEPDNESAPIEEVLRTGESYSCEHQVQDERGVRWIERTASPMCNEQGEVEFVIEVIRDTTHRKQLEQEQMERSRLQGIVELAGTVAHEINSPLFAALGTAQMLEEDLEQPELVEDVRRIIHNLKTISRLTGRMTTMTGFRPREYVGGTTIVDF